MSALDIEGDLVIATHQIVCIQVTVKNRGSSTLRKASENVVLTAICGGERVLRPFPY
jgi:hypothetical protein